jgi:hypothetical protein
MIGTKFAHYEITSHLGSGGMGDGYQSTDSRLGRSVVDSTSTDLSFATRRIRSSVVLLVFGTLTVGLELSF